MKLFNGDPGLAAASRPGGGRLPRRWPVATVSVLAVTVVLTVLQFPFPQLRLDLWRAPGALAAGQWWRLATPLLVQYDAVWQILVVLACIAGSGSWPNASSATAAGCCCTWSAAWSARRSATAGTPRTPAPRSPEAAC